jgi:hypothetical protein
MWESRVLCEISKSLWEALFAFHRDGISTAVFAFGIRKELPGAHIRGMLYPCRPADRRSWRSYAVVFAMASHPIVTRGDQRRRLGSTGPGVRDRRDARGGGAEGAVGRERSVR